MKQSKSHTIRNQVLKVIQKMPKDVTFDEIVENINDLRDKIEESSNSDKLSDFFKKSPLNEIKIDLERDKTKL